jgi:hypothetical protein
VSVLILLERNLVRRNFCCLESNYLLPSLCPRVNYDAWLAAAFVMEINTRVSMLINSLN